MRAGLAQARCISKCAGAVVVQAAQEWREVASGHGRVIEEKIKRTNLRERLVRTNRFRTTVAAARHRLTKHAYERSFQLSAWMMLPSLYAHVIFS